jgi:NADPH:quinone reductase-like Zn-dependent oxidoreductase
MNAVLFYQHGGPEVLEYTQFPTPKPQRGQALVHLKAAALNRMDLIVRTGWPGIKLEYPHILGADGAGEVVEVGEGVTSIKPGERVVINSNLRCGKCEFCMAGLDNRCREWALLGETVKGTYAEYVALPERNLYPLPDGFNEHAAAAASLVFHTAWHSLIKRGRIRPGEHVLIVGASGGVNTASIQIAKMSGAIVYVVGSNAEKLELAALLGADFLIDRSQDENWSRTVFMMTDKRGVDVIVDNVGTTYPQSFRAARKGGRILNVGNTGGHRVEIDNRFVFAKHLSILGSTMGTRQDFSQVMDLVFSGKLKSVVDRDFHLRDARQAHEYLASGNQFGKVTLSIE